MQPASLTASHPRPRVEPVAFASVLLPDGAPAAEDAVAAPACLTDLNLDQVFDAILDGRDEYRLAPFLQRPLADVEQVAYRHEVLRDLERAPVAAAVAAFAQAMRATRSALGQARQLHYRHERQARLLQAARRYCDGVRALADELATLELGSRGLRGLRGYLRAYTAGAPFGALAAEVAQVERALAAVRYCLEVGGSRIRVTRYEEQPDYSVEVQETFARFRQGAVNDYRVRFPARGGMDHVEAGVVERVARLHPDAFAALERFCVGHADFANATVVRFDREVQLYLAYLQFIAPLRARGLPFCYPQLDPAAKDEAVVDAFDVALAHTLADERAQVVCNDWELHGPERILVVSGPNQGGKTTFARAFGQLHHLASLGLPVPARSARLLLCDHVYTHFERVEDVELLRGKLEDELTRVHAILDAASARSVVVMNESFASTTLRDARMLGARVLEQLVERDLIGVSVTFVEELARLGAATVSMTSMVDPHDPTVRTFKVRRRAPDGRAYATVLAEQYGLTYARLRERIGAR